MITAESVLAIFEKYYGYLKGHYELTSGLHSRGYMQCALVLQHPEFAEQFGKAIAEQFQSEGVTCVMGPAMGGVIIAHEVARALKARCCFAERKDGQMVLRRGFQLSSDDVVLVVEDVVTTGGSVLEVVKLIQNQGIRVCGVASIVDRSSGTAQFPVPFKPLTAVHIETFEPEECPMCAQMLPLDKPGSRSL